MRIRKIEWKNYRPYVDHSMAFSENKPTIVINWVNGVGKTSFLNSIYWCLYGEEIFPVRRFIPNGDSVKNALRESKNTVQVEVKILLESDSGKSILLTRVQEFRVVSVNEVQPIGMSTLEGAAADSTESGFAPIGAAQDWVSRTFPRRLSPHFFIDGQNLQNFRVDVAPRRDALASIASIDALGKEIEHLEQVKNDISGEIRKSARSSTEEAKDATEELETRLRQIDSLKENLEAQMKKFRDEHGDLDQLEKENDAVRKAQQRLDELLADRSEARSSATEAELAVIEGLQNLPAVILQKEIAELIGHSESESVSIISEAQVAAVLDQGVCICGADLSKPTHANKHLTEILKNLRSKGGSSHIDVSEIKRLNALALQSKGELSVQWGGLREALARKKRIDSTIQDFKNQHESLLDSDLNSASAEDIYKMIGAYRAYEVQLAEQIDERKELQRKLEELSNQVLAEEIDKDDPRSVLQHELRFVQHLIDQAKSIHEKGMEDVRVRLSDVFESLFRKMASDENSAYESVELDKDLNVRVADADGQERQSGFSAGWALVAAFAFAYSLNAIAGFELPLIVDTPFGSLSKERKKLLARTLSDATSDEVFKGRQFIVLVTDTEADHGVAEEFSGPHTQWFTGSYDTSSQAISYESRS